MSIFSKVKAPKVRRNTFNLSHDRKFSTKFGKLTPILVIDTVPGDSFRLQTSQMVRFAPMVAPIMHRVSVYTHFFFVPNRLLWPNWENFITGGEDGLDASVFPYIDPPGNLTPGNLGDYLGLPTNNTLGQVSAFPVAAYNKVFNDYYRDQNLVAAIADELVDGDNSAETDFDYDQVPRTRAWQHDYFTSCLPFVQKGPEATLPLGTSAPIIDNTAVTQPQIAYTTDLTGTVNSADVGTDSAGNPIRISDSTQIRLRPNSTWLADLSTATASSINDLRQAFRLQEWLEKNARGGSRYIESILSHFGVRSSDARLQRPEFLGGGAVPVVISEVLQTSSDPTELTPQGNMAGHGISVGANNGFNYTCEEHGYIIGIMTVMPKSAYQQGLPRHFFKFDKFDYFWPSFANIGEQPVFNKEVFANDADGLDDNVFGYLPRYAEYKYINSSVHGEFRTTLDHWHMGRIFSSRPALNEFFINMKDVEVSRVFAVLDAEKLYVHMHHNLKATRPMPYFGTPKGI